MGRLLVDVQSLTKFYDHHQALKGINSQLYAGEIYGLLGPNGAGKTTFLSITAGLRNADSGSVTIGEFHMGQDELRAKALIGYLPDNPHLYDHLTGAEMLDVVGLLYQVPLRERRERSQGLLHRLHLAGRQYDLLSTYSFGMRKRLALACCLIHRPRVLILDEPTNGLDLEQGRICRELLVEHAREGGAVILSTHMVDLVTRICHRVGILAGGRLITEGAPTALCRQYGTEDLEEMYFLALGAVGQTSQISG